MRRHYQKSRADLSLSRPRGPNLPRGADNPLQEDFSLIALLSQLLNISPKVGSGLFFLPLAMCDTSPYLGLVDGVTNLVPLDNPILNPLCPDPKIPSIVLCPHPPVKTSGGATMAPSLPTKYQLSVFHLHLSLPPKKGC